MTVSKARFLDCVLTVEPYITLNPIGEAVGRRRGLLKTAVHPVEFLSAIYAAPHWVFTRLQTETIPVKFPRPRLERDLMSDAGMRDGLTVPLLVRMDVQMDLASMEATATTTATRAMRRARIVVFVVSYLKEKEKKNKG